MESCNNVDHSLCVSSFEIKTYKERDEENGSPQFAANADTLQAHGGVGLIQMIS